MGVAWRDAGHSVFVQTNNVAGNAVAVYDQNRNGTLTLAGTYPRVVWAAFWSAGADHLVPKARWCLTDDRLLYAVNAGTTVSMFAVRGDRLYLLQVISRAAPFGDIAIHGDLVYVLNARDGASVQGYIRLGDRLFEVPWGGAASGSTKLPNTRPVRSDSWPGCLHAGRVHSPVSTKANSDSITSSASTVRACPRPGGQQCGVVPSDGVRPIRDLVVTETGTSSIVSFDVQPDGGLPR